LRLSGDAAGSTLTHPSSPACIPLLAVLDGTCHNMTNQTHVCTLLHRVNQQTEQSRARLARDLFAGI
jgi:hypothetical protein